MSRPGDEIMAPLKRYFEQRAFGDARRLLLAGIVLSAAAVLAAMLVSTVPAAAHDELVRTVPAENAAVTTPPTTVQVVFGEPAKATGSAVAVLGPNGASVNAGALTVTDATVSQPVKITVAGKYTVNWRVVSADGHAVTGTFAFTVTAVPAPPASASAAPSASPSAASSASPSDSAAATSAAATPSTSAAASSNSGSAALWWVGGIVLLALVVGAVVVLLRRRRPAQS
jgi:methionine-rich copper-binding protein CopC